MNYDKIKRAAFDSFNGNKINSMPTFETQNDNTFDPDYASGDTPGTTTVVRKAVPGQVMQINLTLNNPTASKIIFDLFSAYFNSAEVYKPELAIGNYSRIPGLSWEGLAAQPDNVDTYDRAGNLMIRGNVGDPVATVGCAEYPFKSLVETTKVLGFKIIVIRVSVATQAQFSNNISYILRTYGGVRLNNEINVRSYKKLINPAQLDIDVKAGVVITGESGLQYALEAGEAVQWGLYINKWAKPTL